MIITSRTRMASFGLPVSVSVSVPVFPHRLPRDNSNSDHNNNHIDFMLKTRSIGTDNGDWRAHATDEDLALESWSQGFLVGSLVIMAAITIANMRKKVLLHKLVLLEQLMAMCHGTFCFMDFKGYGWYLSSTATLLYLSWIVHNIVAWMKIKPFFLDQQSMFKRETGLWVRNIYLSTLAMTVPVNIFQIFNNFRFFNNINDLYTSVRPYEPLIRDPWWIFTCLVLFHVIRKCYGTSFFELIRKSPRFGILLAAIMLSITFTALDIAASIHNFIGGTDGINPWWKLSLVFKCLTDTIVLDDFKTELKRLGVIRVRKQEETRNSAVLVFGNNNNNNNNYNYHNSNKKHKGDALDDQHLGYSDPLGSIDQHSPSLTNDDNHLLKSRKPRRGLFSSMKNQAHSSEARTATTTTPTLIPPRNRSGKGGKRIGLLPPLLSSSILMSGENNKNNNHNKNTNTNINTDPNQNDRDEEKGVISNEAENTATLPPPPPPTTTTPNNMMIPTSLDAVDFQTRPEGY